MKIYEAGSMFRYSIKDVGFITAGILKFETYTSIRYEATTLILML